MEKAISGGGGGSGGKLRSSKGKGKEKGKTVSIDEGRNGETGRYRANSGSVFEDAREDDRAPSRDGAISVDDEDEYVVKTDHLSGTVRR